MISMMIASVSAIAVAVKVGQATVCGLRCPVFDKPTFAPVASALATRLHCDAGSPETPSSSLGRRTNMLYLRVVTPMTRMFLCELPLEEVPLVVLCPFLPAVHRSRQPALQMELATWRGCAEIQP
eukprot:gnl/TRDRNA2_/TRDRNA2_115890_c0_seq1.p2 gnl/TRDRNA2_/TRDRNA2_115890_c0~~gnl/TRDRNA2_/TRDRNA2_115890_c0_seq1.p2  ORF type:complete len:125 (+),score=10.30 gnl/TRDRNA2_/TRDRNA2_115890_c0_seq1:152-526(+)